LNIVIDGELTDFNTFQNKTRSNRFAGSAIKKSETERVAWCCKKNPLRKVTIFPVLICFRWFSKNSRKDLDNVAFSKKFILDGMVMAGVLPDDSREYVSGFSDEFYIDKENPRVEVVI
jgi:Holliday junction resolvase RusA-like endonuclease